MSEDSNTEEILVIDRGDLDEVRRMAADQHVDVTVLPKAGVEPIATVTLILVGSAFAIGTITHFADQRKGGQVIDLRPSAPAVLYRSRQVQHGLVIILALDGSVTVEVKEPKGMLGTAIQALTSLATELGKHTIDVVADAVREELGDAAEVSTHPSNHRLGGPETSSR